MVEVADLVDKLGDVGALGRVFGRDPPERIARLDLNDGVSLGRRGFEAHARERRKSDHQAKGCDRYRGHQGESFAPYHSLLTPISSAKRLFVHYILAWDERALSRALERMFAFTPDLC